MIVNPHLNPYLASPLNTQILEAAKILATIACMQKMPVRFDVIRLWQMVYLGFGLSIDNIEALMSEVNPSNPDLLDLCNFVAALGEAFSQPSVKEVAHCVLLEDSVTPIEDRALWSFMLMEYPTTYKQLG